MSFVEINDDVCRIFAVCKIIGRTLSIFGAALQSLKATDSWPFCNIVMTFLLMM